MKGRRSVLIAGRSKDQLEAISEQLSNQLSAEVGIRYISNGHSDPLYGIDRLPDILIFVLSQQWQYELEAYGNRPVEKRTGLIVVGPSMDTHAVRASMRLGARDFLTQPVAAPELIGLAQDMLAELASLDGSASNKLITVMNAKGGSGASFLACNIAHSISKKMAKRTVIVDMELQFSAVPLYLDIKPQRGLTDLIANIHDVDAVAFRAYVTRHHSGLDVLATAGDQLGMPWDIPEDDLRRLIDIVGHEYQVTVADLPRQIDALTASFLERSDEVVLVVQQSLAGIRDAKRLSQIVQQEFGLDGQRLRLVVNRYTDQVPITEDDIRQAIGISTVYCIPSDYNRVARSIDTGVPLGESESGAAITKSIQMLALDLMGAKPQRSFNQLRATLGGWFTR